MAANVAASTVNIKCLNSSSLKTLIQLDRCPDPGAHAMSLTVKLASRLVLLEVAVSVLGAPAHVAWRLQQRSHGSDPARGNAAVIRTEHVVPGCNVARWL